jgi:RNA polymerase sigma-70 factor (ECF subfamily)
VSIATLLEHLFRRQSAQMVATLTRTIGARHLSLAEEAVQDAMVTALQQWPYRGLPDNPAAWLFRVARNRALDRLRHERIVADRAGAIAMFRESPRVADPPHTLLTGEIALLEDDELGLMFMTCHPSLSPDSRMALTLKMAGGFSVGEIARALVADERAIAQRLVRAKRLLREGNVAFGRPDATEIAERLDSVLDAIYLMFNEGYAATSGDALIREDFTAESIRLGSMLTRHGATALPKTWALVALTLLHAARFAARVGSDGQLFLLRDQDRSLWDRRLMAEGLRALDRAAAGDEISRYHYEAEIAACHAVAACWADTDWPRILDCYDHLWALTGSPVVALNRAIALARVEGPVRALAEVETIATDRTLDAYHLLPAVQAELWRDAGDPPRAAAYYRQAITLAACAPERKFLAGRLASLVA